MVSQDVLLRIVGDIYDAGGDARLWARVLTSISDALGGAGASLVVHDLQSTTGGIAASVRVDPDALSDYAGHYVKLDPWLAQAQRTGKIRPGLVLMGDELVRHDEFVRTAYCQEFADRYGITRLLGGAVLVEGATSSSLSLLRSAEYTESELEFVRHLMPHLARALQYHQRFSDLERTRQSAADALERLPIGVMLLDASGRVLLANRAARAILDLDDGLGLQAKRPVAALHAETLRLRRFITSALTRGVAHDGAGGALSVSRPSHRRPFEVLVTPLGESAAGDLGHGAATAALFVSDPERAVQADARVLQQLYGLTRTEARVATGLAGGLSIREIAEANAMTMNTARWHSKHVFAKTDTAGQSDLVRLLVAGPATVRPSPS